MQLIVETVFICKTIFVNFVNSIHTHTHVQTEHIKIQILTHIRIL